MIPAKPTKITEKSRILFFIAFTSLNQVFQSHGNHFPACLKKKIRVISKLIDRIFFESLARPRKGRQIAPQASAGH
jgi:hypothetical protein